MRESRVTPIAVIGMACRLPGGIDSPDLLWESLLRGDDLISEIPAARWDGDEYYDPEPGVPGRSVSRWGGFLDDIAGFDFEFFGYGEREATAVDPQHRLLLETSWEAIENAGLAPTSLVGSSTGVFIGLSHDDYELVAADAGVLEGGYGFTGTAFSMASGRIAYALGLHGPAITMDTACSTGLLSLHLACRSLHEGESTFALAGGCAVMLDPRTFVSASVQGMLSPTGRCHSFDVAADGFVRAEGCAVVLLKRLPDAVRDGDRILAVVRGTAANHDGRTDNISTPSLDAQVAVYQEALAVAAVDAGSVGAVEAHGTGTPVGDPIEYGSLSRVYGADHHSCVLGSAKTNLGHSEAAAGVVGLIKAILQLRHGVVPPMLHFTRLPDDLACIESDLIVPQSITPWPANSDGTPRRAAVSSYGVSGTNVHAVLEQAPEPAAEVDESPTADAAGPLLFAVSATSVEELRRTSSRLADWVETQADRVAAWDLAYTLARRRAHRPVRTAVIAASQTELVTGLREVAESEIPVIPAVGQDDRGPVWIFSGQGSQWAAMGADLLKTEPMFAATVAEAEPLIAYEAGFSVTEAMSAATTVSGIDHIQPTLFTMQVALAAAMQSHGVRPSAVIGHSLGEVAAAVVAGALSLRDGVRVICRRSRLCARLAGAGAMASVELPAQRVQDELAGHGVEDVVVSVVASPQSTVIGGATQAVRELVAEWEARDLMAREVAVDVASHSPQVDPILTELADILAELAPMTPEVPFYSATLDDPRGIPDWDADYWVANLRHPVQFAKAVEAALEDGHRVFAELAPHPLLTRAVEQTAQAIDVPVQALASMRRDQEAPHGLLAFLADVHGAGATVDFAVLYPSGRLVDAPLPTWSHPPLLISSDGREHAARGAHSVAVHPLLGAHVRLLEQPERHAWQADVGTTVLPWANDHRVHNVPSLPGAAFCEMALAAARTLLGEASEVRDIRFEEMLLLDEHTSVNAVASIEEPGSVDFVVETEQDGERTRRSVAVLKAAEDEPEPPRLDIAALLDTHPRLVDGTELRERFDRRGVQFGPAFTGLVTAGAAEGEALTVLARVALPAPLRAEHVDYCIHPALLDACFQSVAAHSATSDASGASLLLALGVRRLRLYGAARDTRYCFTRVIAGTGTEVEADIDLLDEEGKVVLAVRGLRLGGRASGASERDRVLSERLMTIDWQPRTLPAAPEADTGDWLLLTTAQAEDLLAAQLADALKSLGAPCRTVCWPEGADHRAAADVLDAQLSAGRIIGLVILGGSSVGEPDEQGLMRGREKVRHLVRIASQLADFDGESPRLYLLTTHAQAVLADDRLNLDQAGLRGLMRVIGSEHPQLRPTQIDLDDDSDAEQVALELLSGSAEDETAWRGGQWYNARLRPTALRPDERRIATANHEHDGVRLEVRVPGDLETLEFAAIDRIPPGPGQIEVAVTASSVNFADVLIAFGRHSSFDGRRLQLGNDFAGVVSAIGPEVSGYQIGDRVGGYTPGGTWRTFVTCDARFTAPVPPRLTTDQAAAVPIAYGTAWYGLRDLARIESGDRVLIHSATGGVGQAAIEIARCAGAEIFATAGSPSKRELLRDMGIDHVYDSRTTEFADLIRDDTDGDGVDIVLNSLTGAAQRAGFELLAFGGRFVEIGKRDVYDNTRLGLYPFRRNLTFFYLDLTVMAISHPQQIYDLLRTVYKLTGDGVLALPQCTQYPIAEASTAIRQMSAAEHTGKLVLSLPHEGHSSVVVPPERARIFRADGSYIITGGLGGLGLFLAAGMAAAGCGRIILTGRSQPNPQALKAIARIRATGADIQVECGNIADPATATRLVDAATASGLPVRGVLHAAAVVDDATLTNISDELIDRDWSPKVYGVWHLHNATACQPLDWFCSFSSAAALLGSPGQGAYAAANSWLDGFTFWRRAQGLPATAIAWGAWAEIGRGASLAEGGQTTMITPAEGAYAFQMLLRHDRGYSGYVPIVGTPWLTALAQRSAFAEAFQESGSGMKATNAFREELRSLPRDEWPGRLRHLVGEQVSLILRRSVDPDRPFSDHGLDSLGNLELRTRIETETGIRVTPKAVATHNTVRAMAAHLSESLSDEDIAAAG